MEKDFLIPYDLFAIYMFVRPRLQRVFLGWRGGRRGHRSGALLEMGSVKLIRNAIPANCKHFCIHAKSTCGGAMA